MELHPDSGPYGADSIDVLVPNDVEGMDDMQEEPQGGHQSNFRHHHDTDHRNSDGNNDRDYPRRENSSYDRRERNESDRRDSDPRSRHDDSTRGDVSRDHDRDDKYDQDRYRSSHTQDRRSRSRSPGNSSGGAVRDRRVYVGNLSYDVKWTHLKDFMREIGPVAHADVLLSHDGRSKGCGVVEYQNAEDAKTAIRKLNDVVLMGRPVFVREDREPDARIGFSGGKASSGRREVAPSSSSGGGAGGAGGGGGGSGGGSGSGGSGSGGGGNGGGSGGGSGGARQVFVGNLPYSVNWKDLKDLFRRAGAVDRADVFMTRDNRSKGSGTVSFESSYDVGRAISMFNSYEWHGRRIEVREDKYGPPAGGSSREAGPPAASSSSSSRYEHSREYGRGGGDSYGYGHGSSGRSDARDGRGHDSYNSSSRSGDPRGDDINMANVPSGPAAEAGGDQIYIRNLPLTTTNQDLRDLFRTCGPIRMAEVLESTGRSKASGVVRFEHYEAAQKAVTRLNGYVYGGRPLEILYDR